MAQKVGVLTAGGLAPCLSSALGYLIEMYTEADPSIEIICYKSGYKGLLLGDSIVVSAEMRAKAGVLQDHGGSPIGNSRVKLTNLKDCVARGLTAEGEVPLEKACKQLVADGVTILHTVGGDDTNTQAAELAKYLAENDYKLTVVGLPKTIDNDVYPIKQSLGAYTAAEHGANYFANVVNELSANPRMLILHEVMGRDCGWLTAYTAKTYRERLASMSWMEGFNGSCVRANKEVHAVYIPEMNVDIDAEALRLKAIMDANDNVNIFLSEGAGVESIVAEMEAKGEEVPRDAFGHIKLDKVNPGAWFAKQFAEKIGADKVLVQKSGYYSRAAAANEEDKALIKQCCRVGVDAALAGQAGCVGHDDESDGVGKSGGHLGELRAIEFPRIKGGKPFDKAIDWFQAMLGEIGQPDGAAAAAMAHGDGGDPSPKVEGSGPILSTPMARDS